MDTSSSVPPVTKKKAVKAVGPRLRGLLHMVFVLLAILFINSAYLGTLTALEWMSQASYQNHFYQYMFLALLVLWLLLVVPLVVFAFVHLANTRHRKNRRAVSIGYVLLVVSVALMFSGLLLFRVSSLEVKHPTGRGIVYWVHVVSPLVAVWFYVLHRLAGPKIKWKYGAAYSGFVVATVCLLALLHHQDPRQWNVVGPDDGENYFRPSLARTVTGEY